MIEIGQINISENIDTDGEVEIEFDREAYVFAYIGKAEAQKIINHLAKVFELTIEDKQ